MAKKTELFPKREERVAYSGKAGADVERNRGKKADKKHSAAENPAGRKEIKPVRIYSLHRRKPESARL